MTPERWKQIEALYHAARALPAADRSTYLSKASPGDAELQREVERLLSQPSSNEGWLAGNARDVSAGLATHQPALVNKTLGGYEMQALIGVGGMGEVYRARDLKLGRDVAIKVLPAAFTSDPGRLARFDREARMLAALNHPNICAIHGFEHDGDVRFLVLELVKGQTLAEVIAQGHPEAEGVSPRLREGASAAEQMGVGPHSQLKKRGLPLTDALKIARQIARALNFAHERGIVHRDLKPANVKVTSDGAVKVLDFGLAKATAGDTAGADLEPAPSVTHNGTIEGALLGTPAYMSPEQARGKPVDKRADIWAFGCVLYEMLTGRAAFHGDTLADTIAKVIEREPDWTALPRSTPEPIRNLLLACLVKDSQQRLQDIGDVTIESVLSGSASGATMPLVLRRRPPKWLWMAAAGLVLAAVAWTWLLRDRSVNDRPPPGAARPMVSIALVPFRNASGDATLDSLGSVLTQLLGTALGHSASARTVSVDRVHEVMRDLGIAPNAAVGPLEIARIADFTSARRVVWGSYTKTGASIRIDAVLQDLEQARSEPLVVTAPDDNALPAAISELAASVRNNVWRAAPGVLKELEATSWRPSTSSFNALRLYCEGKQLILDGWHQQEALKKFEEATRQDDRFALALSAVGLRYAMLGDDNQASQAFLRAMTLSEALRPQERFLIWTENYWGLNDVEKAIESYERLLEVSPNSEALEFKLGMLYEQSGKFELAKLHLGKATELDRKFVGALLALGRVEIKGGNALGSFAHLNEALTVVTQLNNDEVRANILQAIGIQYKRLDRMDEALRSFESALEVKRRLGDKRSIAATLSQIAQIYEMQGQPQRAERSYQDAVALQRQIGDKSGLSNSLVNLAVLFTGPLSRPDDALPLLREALHIRRESGDRDAEALVLNSIGNVFLAKGEFSDAQTYFEQTLEIREKAKAHGLAIADVLHSLGETLTKLGRYDQALARYGRALGLRRGDDKRGAAIESYAMGIIFDYQGRYGAAIKSKEEALQAFRDLKQRDQWLAEILSGYGHSLSLSGRLDDAIAPLNEAMTLAKELQQHSLIGQLFRQQTERLYYSGQRGTVAELAEAASRASDRRWSLADRVAAAKIALTVNPPRTLGATFSALGQEAADLGQWPLAVECWTRSAATRLKGGDRSAARKELQRALAKAETLGLRVQLAEAHYLFAEVLRFSTDPAASSEYRRALQLLDQIKAEDGNQNILRRADLAFIHAECTRWSK